MSLKQNKLYRELYEETDRWVSKHLSSFDVTTAPFEDCFVSPGKFNVVLSGVTNATPPMQDKVAEFLPYTNVCPKVCNELQSEYTHYISIPFEEWLEHRNSGGKSHGSNRRSTTNNNKAPNPYILLACVVGFIVTAAAALLID